MLNYMHRIIQPFILAKTCQTSLIPQPDSELIGLDIPGASFYVQKTTYAWMFRDVKISLRPKIRLHLANDCLWSTLNSLIDRD